MDLPNDKSSPLFVFTRWHSSFDLVSDVWWARKNTYSGMSVNNLLKIVIVFNYSNSFQ